MCVDSSNEKFFEMRFLDAGLSNPEKDGGRKSRLEEEADIFFRERGFRAVYEPCIFSWGLSRHYTPDFFLPEVGAFVEIKGFWSERGKEPTEETLDKCRAVSRSGFSIILAQGNLNENPTLRTWSPFCESPQEGAPWWWNKRKHT